MSTSRVILAEYYRPKHVREMVGNAASRYAFILRLGGTIALRHKGLSGMKAVEYAKNLFKKVFGKDLNDAIKRFRSERSKGLISKVLNGIKEGTLPAAALLVGPPGVGKTTLVYAAANDIGRDVFELNASDFRNATTIRTHVMKALTAPHLDPNTFTLKDHIVFLDEVDGLSAIGDAGGASALYRILLNDKKNKFIRYPLVLAANDRYATSVRLIRDLVLVLDFYRPSVDEVMRVLKRILKLEAKRRGLDIDPDSPEVEKVLYKIALASNGDLRSAIEDLQVYLDTNTPHASRKNRELAIAEFLRIIISDKVKNLNDLRRELLNYDDDPKLLIYRVMENLPLYVRDPNKLAEAMRFVADADMFYERASRGNRSLLRYVTLLATYPLARYIDQKPKRHPSYLWHIKVERPSYILKLSRSREQRRRLMESYAAAAKKIHVSRKKFLEDVIPYFRVIAMYKPEELLGVLDEDSILSIVPEKERDKVAKRIKEYLEKREEERRKKKEEKKEKKATKKKSPARKEKAKKEEGEKKTGTLEDFLGDLIRAF